jgi:microcystin-dependent protein
VSSGQGPGLSDRPLGSAAGEESVTLTTDGLPAHSHAVIANGTKGARASPGGKGTGARERSDGVRRRQ